LLRNGAIPYDKCIDINFDLVNASYAIYMVPDTDQVKEFAAKMNETWIESGKISVLIPKNLHKSLDFIFLANETELEMVNQMSDSSDPVHLAVVFDGDPKINMLVFLFLL